MACGCSGGPGLVAGHARAAATFAAERTSAATASDRDVSGQAIAVTAVDPAGYAALTADTPFPRVAPAAIAATGQADQLNGSFDVSNPDSTKWFGDVFLDLYNQTVDTSTTSWQDGQSFDVPMVASLDSTGSLVLNIASGSTASR